MLTVEYPYDHCPSIEQILIHKVTDEDSMAIASKACIDGYIFLCVHCSDGMFVVLLDDNSYEPIQVKLWKE